MRRNRFSALPLLFVLMAAVPCIAQAGLNEKKAVADALKAIEACQHWASEPGEGGAAREQEIAEQSVRYCTLAQNKAEAAYKLHPTNGQLAAGILQLLDIYYFDSSAETKQKICTVAASYFKAHPEKLDEEGDSFHDQCPTEAQLPERAGVRY